MYKNIEIKKENLVTFSLFINEDAAKSFWEDNKEFF